VAYLIDANVFIQAKNLHYGFDFCPAFWDWLTSGNRASKLFSIEKVGDELKAGDDQLEEWAKARGASFFVPPDKPVVGALATVSTWVYGQSFTPASVSTFLQGADYYLVAHALAHGHTVVTHETPANTPNRIKIPSVCIPLKVKVMNPYEMLRVERARFVLGPAATKGAAR
jgi:hypothetical protein